MVPLDQRKNNQECKDTGQKITSFGFCQSFVLQQSAEQPVIPAQIIPLVNFGSF